MTKLFICTQTDCPNNGVEYRLTDPMPITICGACKSVIDGVEVNE